MPAEHAKKYFNEMKKTIDALPLDKLEEIIAALKQAYKDGRHIFIMGNGGSAATASHFACDLAKGTAAPGVKGFKAIALTDNVPLMTAWGNDSSYEKIFSGQLESLLEKDDLAIIFTGSGNSKNVLQAASFARAKGAKVIAFTGYDGGKIKDLADICLIVSSDCMERIEDLHLALEHLIHLYLLEELRSGRMGEK